MDMKSIIPGLKFGYNKVFVNEADRKRKIFEGLIPKLKSRKQLLYLNVQIYDELLAQYARELDEAKQAAAWTSRVKVFLPTIEHQVLTTKQIVAGVEVDAYQNVRFAVAPYSLFATPACTDEAIERQKALIGIKEKIQVTRVVQKLLQEEFDEVSRQLAVFEDKFVPWLEEAIRKVKLTLGDEEALQAGISGMVKKRREGSVSAI
ncbi:MAG: V-type ATP synthase subunit D [Desulfobacterales bacterium]|nr:V-type ATP synthase subunit D [Desulfobacterales bacterium]